jgi:uncharacterized protein involved in type VI secretion and phage assembly
VSRRKGVLTGFVAEVDARQGRVKVEFRALEQDLLSSWAYVAAPMSGKQRGMLFMPEVGDEVLVAFADGDFGHPYVIGYLWNGEQVSPETEPDQRVVVTPGGHQLRFEDKPGAKRVRLESDGARRLVLDDIGAGRVEIVSGRNRVVLDDDPAGTKVELQAGSGVGVRITMNATPQPSLSIAVGAGNTLEVSATGFTLNASGPVAINAASSSTLNVGGSAAVTVGAAASLTVGGAASLTVGGALSINCAALNVNAGIANFAGALKATTLIGTSVVGTTYTPGVGNLL